MKHYENLLNLEVFTLEEAREAIGGLDATKKVLQRYKKSGLIKQVHRNLYCSTSLENRNAKTNRYLIASKLNKDAHLVCHSAFEVHGYANQVSFEVWVASEKRFDSFEFEGTRYNYAGKGLNIGVIKYKLNQKILVTDLERTVVDSLKNIHYAGGSHELDECLAICPRLDNQKLMTYLKKYHIQFLYKKAGFFLERHKNQLGIKSEVIELCKQMCGQSVRYLDDEAKNGSRRLVRCWGLIIPATFQNDEEDNILV